MPLQWQKFDVPLAAGLQTRQDPRALEPPSLTRALNAEFTELGGIQKRKPYASIGTDIEGGGTLSNIRRLATYRDELIAFTDTGLYSWSPSLETWQDRGEHLAVASTERTVFTSTTEQIDPDRAELDGVIVYTWTDAGDGFSRVAALDAESGAVLLFPTRLPNDGQEQAKVRAVGTNFHIYAHNGSGNGSELFVDVIAPADIATLNASAFPSVSTGAGTGGGFDVDVVGDTAYVAWQGASATSYGLASVSEAGTVARQTESRRYDGPIAIAARGTGTALRVVVVRPADLAGDEVIVGDLFDDSLTVTDTNVIIGDTSSTTTAFPDQVGAAFRDVAESGGEFRCIAFWSTNETSTQTDFRAYMGYIDTDGDSTGVGGETVLAHRVGLASRPFDHDGAVYAWFAFAADTVASGQRSVGVQHTYVLLRDDGDLIARAVQDVGGGFAQTEGHLPNVQDLTGSRYGCLALERRVLVGDEGNQSYAARAPREVVIEFDADSARRTAELGRTLYLPGALPQQYDGAALAEIGFVVYPWGLFLTLSDTGLAAGTYTWIATYAWENAAGELERSTTTAVGTSTLTQSRSVAVSFIDLHLTKKQGDLAPVRIEVWRSLTLAGEPLYRITDPDPSETTGDNRYVENDPTSGSQLVDDVLSDDDASEREQILLPGRTLPDLPPASATVIMAHSERIFLAGIANAPHQVHYSKIRDAGWIASFNDGLKVDLPSEGGPITALAVLGDTLIAFCESAIYALPGDGFDNLGAGQNFGPPRTISVDVGAQSQEAIGVTSDGIVFHGSKGWHLLTLGGGVQYIGGPVEDFDADEFVAVHVLEGQHQIRCLSTARCLVYDTVAGQWAEWELEDAVGAVIWQGAYVYATASGVFSERSDYTGVDYSIDIETAWIKVADQLQNFGRWRRAVLLGERRDTSFAVRVRIGRNYATGYFDDRTKVLTGSVGAPLQFSHRPKYGRAQALRFRITDMAADAESVPDSEGMKLTGLSLNVGIKRGLPRLAAALKQ
jgi:hypothetical protein